MLSFLNTVILFGLVGVAVPVLIHLFARQKLQRIEFSSTEFLRRIQIRKMRRVRLRQLLLLILRCTVILLCVLAFARPTLRSRSGMGQSQARSSVVLLVDRSMSMRRKGLFQKAKEKAASVLDLLHGGDEAALIWTGSSGDKEPSFKHSGYGLKQAISNKKVSWMKSTVSKSIEEAAALLSQSHNLNQEIYLVTDLQTTGFPIPSDSTFERNWEGTLFVLPIMGELDNVAVIDGGVENQIIQPGLPLRVFAEIKNCGKKRVEEILVRIFLEGEAVAQKVISLNAGEMQRVSFRVMPKKEGCIWGTIRIEENIFLQDNEWFFSCRIPERIRVILAGKNSEDIRPMKLVLGEKRETGKFFDVTEVLYGNEWIDQLNETDMIFFSNYPFFKTEEADRLKMFIREGGGVFFWLGDEVNLRNYNEHFFVPIMETSLGNIIMSHKEQDGHLSFGFVDFGHPLFEGVFEKGSEKIRSPQFFRVVEVLGKIPHKIISLGDGKPFLIEMAYKKGNVLLATGGIGEHWSDLVYSTIFAPIIYKGAAYLSFPLLRERGTHSVGESISISTGVEDVNAAYRVEIPSGEEILILPEVQGEEVMLVLPEVESPGIYRFFQSGTLLRMEAINIDPEESDFHTLTEKELKKRFPKAQVKVVKETEKLEPVVSNARLGRELWREILLLGILVLIVEMVIARESRKVDPD